MSDAGARSASASASPSTPETIGRYRVLRELGRGGMATVYLCEHVQIPGRLVAIKLYRASERHSSVLLTRLKTEVENLGRLDHPGIVEVIDSDLADGVPYIVMKYVEGMDLSRWAEIELPKDPARRTRRAVDIMVRIAGAIAAAHDANVIHHDLKPQNVIVPTKGRLRTPVVVDFGTSRRADARDDVDPTLTHGTVPYMAPEEFDVALERDPRLVDVWALGVMLYELIARCRPFQGDTAAAVRYAILHRTPIPLTDHVPGIEPAIASVVMHALAKDPQERPASVRLFRERLVGALNSTIKRSRAKEIAAVAVILVIGLGVAVKFWDSTTVLPELSVVAVDGLRMDANTIRAVRTLAPTFALSAKEGSLPSGSFLVIRERDGARREVGAALIPRSGATRTSSVELRADTVGPLTLWVRTPTGHESLVDSGPWIFDRSPPTVTAEVTFPDGRRKSTTEIVESDLDVGTLRIEVHDEGGTVGLSLAASGRVIDDIPEVVSLSRPLHDLVGSDVVILARDRAGNRTSHSFTVPPRPTRCRIETPPNGRLTVSVEDFQTRVPILGGGDAPEVTVVPASAMVGTSPRERGVDIILALPLDRLEVPLTVSVRTADGAAVTASLTIVRPLPAPGEPASILKLVDGASKRDDRFTIAPGKHTLVFESYLEPRPFAFAVRCRLVDPRSGKLLAEGDVQPTDGISGKSFDLLKAEIDIPAKAVDAGGVAVEFVMDDGNGHVATRPVAGAFLSLIRRDSTQSAPSSRPKPGG